MIVTRITRTTCDACGYDGDCTFHKRLGWKAKCPGCGKPVHPEDSKPERTYGNRRFSGEGAVSVKHGFHPNEVKYAKRLMKQTGDCIRSDGTVEFPDSQTARKFERELAQVMDRTGVPKGDDWKKGPLPKLW